MNVARLDHHDEARTVVAAPQAAVFAYLDDHTRLASHMNQSSWQMGGGRMETTIDEGRGQKVGSHIRMAGRVLGITVVLDEVVTAREPPSSKTWETVGAPRLLVVGSYRMGFSIEPHGADSLLRVSIDYELPNTILARLLGRSYARWCVNRMVQDAVAHFRPAARRP